MPSAMDTTNGHSDTASGYQFVPLWTGPSKLTTILVAKIQPFDSLLKPSFKGPTAFNKQPHIGPIFLGQDGFTSDERAYPAHRIPDRAVLQYNPNHYPLWRKHFSDIKVASNTQRDALLNIGGFGENVAVEDSPDTPTMDESTMCIGDLVVIVDEDGTECARLRLTSFRMPCYKLNHRFGIPTMSQQTQDSGRTGWFYSVEKEGKVEVGNKMVLIERPFPEWPVSRVQYFCYTEPRNLDMAKRILDTLNAYLAPDITSLLKDRLAKGMEDMSLRLKGDQPKDKTVEFKLVDKIQHTSRVSEFVLERVNKLSEDSKSFADAASGSHVYVHMEVNNQTIMRPYSVVSGHPNRFSLGIALADDSRGGSAYMHNTLKVNDIVHASKSFLNTFQLATEDVNKHIFIAGGIGITAMIDHVRYCFATSQPFELHYLIRNELDYAFKAQIEELINTTNSDLTDKLLNNFKVYTSTTGRCDLTKLLTPVACTPQTHIYACGSERLCDAVQSTCSSLNILKSRVHMEQFSADATGDPFSVKLRSGKTIEVNDRQSLLDALREAGMDTPSSCEAGNCGTCTVKVKSGRVLHKGTALEDEQKAGWMGKQQGEMLACVSRGVGVIELDL